MTASDGHETEGTLTIAPTDEGARVARRFARHAADGALDRESAETLELLVSELVASAGGGVDAELELSVTVQADVVHVELLDAGVRSPAVASIPTEVGRFRAAILTRLTDGMGSYMTGDGCRHWLELRRRGAAVGGSPGP